jgi:serine/threonine protein kinase
MSPEQFTGEKLDTRSDIYSLGISLYQMISGELPFRGETLKTVAKQHFYEASKPLHKLDPMVPVSVSKLVQKMIAKDPKDRYQDMEEVIREIWEVRQKTAPDKDLVPSVHTISIKRLDYELQEISEQRKKQVAEEIKSVKEKADFIKRVLIIGIPVILAVAGLFLIMHYEEQKANRSLELKVNAFAELMSNKSLDIHALKNEWEKTMSSFPSPVNDFQRELHTRMELYRLKIRLKEQMLFNASKEKELKADNAKSDSKKLRKLQAENEKLADQIQSLQAELEAKESMFAEKEAELQEEIKKLMEEKSGDKQAIQQNNKHTKNIADLKKQIEQTLKNDIRIKLSILVAKQKFKEALALLQVELEKHPMYSRWFLLKREAVKNMEKLATALSSSGSKYAGTKIKEGTLKDILLQKVKYVTDDGEIEEKHWRDLDLESLYSIADAVFKDDNKIQPVLPHVYAAFISGNVIAAASLSKNKEVKAVAEAICDYKTDAIHRMYHADQKKAADMARDFLKLLAGTQFEEKYRQKVKQSFTEE